MRRFMVAVLVSIAALVPLTQAASADGGNSSAAHACQQGGYVNLVRSDGSPFADVGSCVSYGAHDGTFVPVTLTATFTADPNRGIFEDLTVTGSGLQPGSTVTYSFIAFSTNMRSATEPTVGNHMVASDGTFSTAWPTGCPLDHSFVFSATTAYGVPISATGC